MATASPGEPGDQAGTIALLWGLRQPPRRGPKPTLTIDQIADAAVDIADTDGLSAVSMQRVAAQFAVTKMALYRYVASKAQLFAVMIEAAVGDRPDLDRVSGGWRPKLREWSARMWETWDHHPWLPGATVGDRVMGPRELAWTECAVRALVGTGLDGHEQIDAVFTLSGHIRNTHSVATAGTQPWTTERQLELLREHTDHFPALIAAVEASPRNNDHAREFGLERILDGLALLIARRRPGPSV